MGSEETGLCIRLKRKRPDVKIIYDPSAIVYHRVPKERAKMFYALRRAFYEGYSKALIKDLATERGYLKFLAKSMLSKIGRLKLIETFGILLIILTVAVGYLYGKFNEFIFKKYYIILLLFNIYNFIFILITCIIYISYNYCIDYCLNLKLFI